MLPAEGLFRGAGGRGKSVDVGHVRGGAAPPIAAAELDPTARGSGAPRGAAGGRVFPGGRAGGEAALFSPSVAALMDVCRLSHARRKEFVV